MGIWYVQTWTIAKGKIQEHDALWKRWIASGKGKVDKKGKCFNKQFGPIGGRIFVIQFDSLADYEQFFAPFYQDEEWLKLQKEWQTLVEPGSKKDFFWQEADPELSINW